MSKTFVCPRCGKEFKYQEGKIRRVTISSDIDNRYGYNPYVTKIINKYYNVRFCEHCNKKLNMNHYLRHVSWFVIPLVAMIIITQRITFMTVSLPIAFSVILNPLAIIIYRDIKMRIPYTKKILEKARNGNAIA